MWYCKCSWVISLSVVFLCLASTAWADPVQEARFARGVEALEQGEVERAIGHLEEVFYGNPGYRTRTLGTAAYWLGRAYEADEAPERARQTWRLGLIALGEEEVVDVPLTDVFIRRVFSAGDQANFQLAAEAYLLALRNLDEHLLETGGELIEAHLRALAAVLPEDIRLSAGLDEPDDQHTWGLADDTGAVLASWWLSQDELPASRANERLLEHLDRFAYASEHYRSEEGRLDDRALVYIRLGEPYHASRVEFDSPKFRERVIRRVTAIQPSDFPDNEFWVYHHVDEAAHFLFVEMDGRFVIGEVEDLIPSQLRTGLSTSERGTRRATSLIWAMEEIYRQLAVLHGDYGLFYAEVADFATIQDMREAVGGTYGIDGRDFPEPPSTFAQTMLSQQSYEEGLIQSRRDSSVPESHSRIKDAYDELPVEARLARFLDEDGTTRTELYWHTVVEALAPSDHVLQRIGLGRNELPRDYFIEGTVAQRDETYRDRVLSHAQHVAADLVDEDARTPDARRVVGPATYVVEGDSGQYHLAVQWSGYLAVDERPDEPVQVGPQVHLGTFRADSLEALDGSGVNLEMSDLKPLDLRNQEVALEDALPYPFADISADVPLSLYFEVYHLTFGADDRTHYRIEYEVVRTREPGAIARLLRDEEVQRSVTEASYEAEGRRAEEYIILDLTDYEGAGELRVNVRVSDETTGETAERTIAFTLREE